MCIKFIGFLSSCVFVIPQYFFFFFSLFRRMVLCVRFATYFHRSSYNLRPSLLLHDFLAFEGGKGGIYLLFWRKMCDRDEASGMEHRVHFNSLTPLSLCVYFPSRAFILSLARCVRHRLQRKWTRQCAKCKPKWKSEWKRKPSFSRLYMSTRHCVWVAKWVIHGFHVICTILSFNCFCLCRCDELSTTIMEMITKSFLIIFTGLGANVCASGMRSLYTLFDVTVKPSKMCMIL